MFTVFEYPILPCHIHVLLNLTDNSDHETDPIGNQGNF